MRALKALTCALAALLCTGALALEADPLQRIAAHIESFPVLRAEFTQSKQVAAMQRPLVTSGHVVVSRQWGVLWQIDKPYRMGYVLAEDRIVEIAADGTRRERGVRELAGLAQVGRVMRALLGANSAALRDTFDATVQGDASRWEVELKPRSPQLAQFLSSVHLSGTQFVQTIALAQADGDSTQIRLRNTTGAGAPSAAELALFGAPAPKSAP